MEFARHCELIVEQAELLAGHLSGADLGTPVPSCPGWNVGQLVRHVGGAHRQASVIARTGKVPDDEAFREPADWTDAPVDELQDWTTAGAHELAKTLLEVGPDVPIEMPLERPTTRFTGRRMAYETAIHRADAALALDVPFVLDTDGTVDALDEWMELGALPFHFEVHPWMRDLLGPGRAIGFRATDLDLTWTVDLTGDAIGWSRVPQSTSTKVEAAATALELLLLVYRRRPVTVAEVHGDAAFLDYYLERVSFG